MVSSFVLLTRVLPKYAKGCTAHRWLHDTRHLLDRGISLANLVGRGQHGLSYGILNNSNLVGPGAYTMPSSEKRTGTVAFMAVDLLQTTKPVHVHRHDPQPTTNLC